VSLGKAPATGKEKNVKRPGEKKKKENRGLVAEVKRLERGRGVRALGGGILQRNRRRGRELGVVQENRNGKLV